MDFPDVICFLHYAIWKQAEKVLFGLLHQLYYICGS